MIAADGCRDGRGSVRVGNDHGRLAGGLRRGRAHGSVFRAREVRVVLRERGEGDSTIEGKYYVRAAASEDQLRMQIQMGSDLPSMQVTDMGLAVLCTMTGHFVF